MSLFKVRAENLTCQGSQVRFRTEVAISQAV